MTVMSATRTWKCPDCGTTTEIDYDWLAANSGPICGSCDCDCELQPEVADDGRSAEVERLANKADAAGLQPEDLDNLVHDLAASVAADVNNSGLEGQLHYLIDGHRRPAHGATTRRIDRTAPTTGTIVCDSIPGNAPNVTSPPPEPSRLFTAWLCSSSVSRAMPTTPGETKVQWESQHSLLDVRGQVTLECPNGHQWQATADNVADWKQ